MNRTFRALKNPNYRMWASGAFISNIGTWLQRTAQDWIVIADLSNQNASAVGIVVALQFSPQLIFLPVVGWAADHFDRRKLLITTNILRASLALAQAVLILTGNIQLWQMYIFAFLLGCSAAFDTPARHAFISDLVSEEDLPNAVSLNSISFNSARMIGPAISGLLIALIGPGWVFLINAISFIPIVYIVMAVTTQYSNSKTGNTSNKATLFEGFRYIWQRSEMLIAICMFTLFALFGMNFAVYLSAMTVQVFSGNSQQYGILMSVMAVGSIIGAMITAGRQKPTLLFISLAAAGFGVSALVASVIPHYWLFAALLIPVGLNTQLFSTSVHSLIQLSAERYLRGRVIAVLLSTSVGGSAIGGPLVGWIADSIGPRWAIACGGAVALLTAAIGASYMSRTKPAQE